MNEVYRGRERKLDANGLSNCTKISDNPRIKTVEFIRYSNEWRSIKPYVGLFRNYWRFQGPIAEIASIGSY